MATPTEWINFQAIKQAVSMEMVLTHYKVGLRRVSSAHLRGDCPLPTHVTSTRGSFTVRTEKNIWECRSEGCIARRDGKKGGNVLDFVAHMETCSVRDAAVKLSAWVEALEKNAPVAPHKELQQLL